MTYTDFLPRELVLKHPESTQWISMVNKRLEITCISKMQTFIPVMLEIKQKKSIFTHLHFFAILVSHTFCL